jgi:hypothetical protein
MKLDRAAHGGAKDLPKRGVRDELISQPPWYFELGAGLPSPAIADIGRLGAR